MKAAYLTGHGGVDKFVYGDLPDPVAGPGEVVVDVHAASVNAADYKVRLGSYNSTLTFPYILGRDFSGVVGALGPGWLGARGRIRWEQPPPDGLGQRLGED